jgi:hypothetical protein
MPPEDENDASKDDVSPAELDNTVKPDAFTAKFLEQIGTTLPAHLRERLNTLGPMLANLTWTRSPEYKAIFAEGVRTRIAASGIHLIFHRITHAPSLAVAGNVVEEQVEIILGWSDLKVIAQSLHDIVVAFEEEISPIPIASIATSNPDGQREVVKTLGLVAVRGVPQAEKGVAATPETASPKRSRSGQSRGRRS